VPNPEQLSMIQSIISRLAGNSFLLRGWTVTLVAGLTAFARADANRSFAFIAVFVVALLGFLDAYYLALERSYRELYRKESARPDDTSWSLKAGGVGLPDILRALLSIAVGPLYLVALGLSLAVALGTG
jgi:hypothetical protein